MSPQGPQQISISLKMNFSATMSSTSALTSASTSSGPPNSQPTLPTCYDTSMTPIPDSFLYNNNLSEGTPYCAIDWPQLIPNLARCCVPGAHAGVYENCTQFCQTTGWDTQANNDFGNCLRIDLNISWMSFQCGAVGAASSNMAQLGPIWTILMLCAYLLS
ncbi:hypothetical protein K461DRAFT_297067 [Myriangium duriaei CBS 260.36]|uniref:Uncharacterized protein n=1 Tax=Myriangium duriaei CBS 260.36 TaxID=1168546 RepID=A0A9P4IW52_9PEZI|nr:hypothetical protein K461DRAFT_297067 [Myriangium duriaei CBS 260.36]